MSEFDEHEKTPTTIPDVTNIPIDAALEAELVEMDMTAEPEETTPVALDACKGCAGPLATPRLSDSVDYPRTADEAWRHWSRACVETESGIWSFCPVTGVAYVPGKVRKDWERRARAAPAFPPLGIERRTRIPSPSGSRVAPTRRPRQ